MEKKLAVYAGTFDPPTLGHLWVIERAAESYNLIVAIGANPDKPKPMFSVEERLKMLKESTAHLKGIQFDSYPYEYLIHYTESVGAKFIIRGIRSEKDYAYERDVSDFNSRIDSGITTITLIPPPGIADVSSSTVKALIGPVGWEHVISHYVPQPVLEKLKQTHRINNLRQEWFGLWESLGARGSASEVLDDLIVRYTEADRHYHDISHIAHFMAELKECRHLAVNINAVRMAGWFHDAVYEIKKDAFNEEESAVLATNILKNAGLSEKFIGLVVKLILATKHTKLPSDSDAKLMVDIDLSSFGLPEKEFDENTIKIREEYKDVPENVFRPGRKAILEAFLDKKKRKSIYLTQFFHDKYETQARRNLKRAIAQLS